MNIDNFFTETEYKNVVSELTQEIMVLESENNKLRNMILQNNQEAMKRTADSVEQLINTIRPCQTRKETV